MGGSRGYVFFFFSFFFFTRRRDDEIDDETDLSVGSSSAVTLVKPVKTETHTEISY